MKKHLRIISTAATMLFCLCAAQTVFAAAAPTVTRYAGQDRFETSRKISEAVDTFADSKYIVIANGMNFPDALAGVPFAASKEAPILLTDGKTLDSGTRGEIDKISPETVYLLGGELAVSKDIENTLSASYKVERISGQDRFGTALAIAEAVAPTEISASDVSESNVGSGCSGAKELFISSGANFPDALSISPVAGIKNAPVLFSDGSGALSEDTLSYIRKCNELSKIYIVGGPYAVGDSAVATLKGMGYDVERIYGQTRYDTSVAVKTRFSSLFEQEKVSLASGENFPDALTGSVYSALARMPIMLVSNTLTNSAVEKSLSGENIRLAVVYGGQYAVSANTVTYLFDGNLSTPAPYVSGTKVIAQKAAPYYATIDTKTRVLGNVVKGSTLNVVQTTYDSEHHAWYLVQFNRDERVWLRRTDILINYLERKGTAKSNAAMYASAAKNAPIVGSLSKGTVYALLEEATGPDERTWFKVIVGGREGWTSRMNFDITNIYHTIPDRNFSGKTPVVYLSPSCQGANGYRTGGTNEQREMEAVAKIIKQILDKEYNCKTFIATPTMDIHQRPDEALDHFADIYIAIHSNATGSSAVLHGSTVYKFPTCNQGDILGRNIVSELDKIAPAKPNFSQRVADGMSAFDNVGYGEVRNPARYGMIGVLAETEFHDNALGSNWIISHHNEIARAYVNAIVKTFGMTRR